MSSGGVLVGLAILVDRLEDADVDVRVVPTGVAMHLEAWMNRRVGGEQDRRKSSRNAADSLAQRMHREHALSHHAGCRHRAFGRGTLPPGPAI